MKEFSVLMMAIMLCFGFSANGYATLTTITTDGKEVVYDDIAEQYWWVYMGTFQYETYGYQQERTYEHCVDTQYYGLSTWHVASLEEMQELYLNGAEEISSHFLVRWDVGAATVKRLGRYDSLAPPELNDTYSRHYLAGLNYDISTGLSTLTPLQTLSVEDNTVDQSISLWVTASAPPVPEPITMLLLSLGLAGIAGIRRKFKN